MRRSTQIILFAIGCMTGIAVGQFAHIGIILLCAAFVVLILLGVLVRKGRYLLIVMLALGIVCGGGRQWLYHHNQSKYTIDTLQSQKLTVVGTVVGEPYYDDKRNHIYYLDGLTVNGRPVAGLLRVKTLVGNAKEGYHMAAQGKVIRALGKAQSQILFARSRVISTQLPFLVKVKTDFSNGIRRALPEPSASFMLGILIGARSTLPKSIQDLLAAVGLSHLVAVSGYNLTIITLAIHKLAGKKWQWGGLAVSLWLIVGFVLLTGASASIVRAGVMSALFLLARYYGRDLDALACVALGAIITLGFNPSYLLGDLSWQLSFLSLTGIIVFAPAIKRLLPSRMNTLAEILSVTLAAQIVTLPLVAYVFGTVSLVAPLSNLLIMPLVPLLMLLGFMAGLAGIIIPNAAFGLFTSLNFVVMKLLDLLHYLGSFSWSAIQHKQPQGLVVADYYALLGLLGVLLRSRPTVTSENRELKNATMLSVVNKETVETI